MMRSSPIKIVAIYLIAGLSWILLSDKLLADFTKATLENQAIITREIIKGFAYVIVTAILLYFLIKYYFRKLQQSHSAYRKLFEDNPCPMLGYDPETFQFLAVNDAFVHKYGYSKDEILSMSIQDIHPREEIPQLLEIIKSGHIDVDETRIWRHLTKAGDELYVSVTSQDTKIEGRNARWVLVQDVTEAKRNELLLKAALERYDLVSKATNDVIWDWDIKAGKATFNGPIYESFGYHASAEDASWFNDKIYPEDLHRVLRSIRYSNKELSQLWSAQFRIKCVDGNYKYVNNRAYIIYDEKKKPVRITGIIQDIQQQKEYERKIESQNKLLREIARICSHELRGPVASIKGLLVLVDYLNLNSLENEKIFHYIDLAAAQLDDVIHRVMEKANQVYFE